jgi:hypothetical protein
MDNTNQEIVARTESNKAKLLLYVVPSPKITGASTSTERDQPLASSLLHKTMIAGGAALILTNITLIILASLKVFGLINFP